MNTAFDFPISGRDLGSRFAAVQDGFDFLVFCFDL